MSKKSQSSHVFAEAVPAAARRSLSFAWKIPAIYLVVTATYILVSDSLVLAIAPAAADQARIQSIKGLVFVLGTSTLLWALLRAALLRVDRAARRQAESAQTLSSIIEWTPAAVWKLGADDRVVFWNRGAAELFGWSPAEARALTFDRLASPTSGSSTRPGQLREAVRRRDPIRLREVELTRRDGGTAIVGLSTAPIPRSDGGEPDLLCIAVDLTPVKSAARQMRLTEHSVRLAPEPVFWLHSNGTFLFANEAAVALFEIEETDLSRVHIHRVLPDFPLDRLKDAAMPDSVSCELECRPAGGGEHVPLWISAGRVRFEGTRAICVFARDVSERRSLEGALRESERYFRSMIDNASDSVVVLTAEGELRFRNRSSARITGWSDEEVLGRKVWENVHPDDIDDVREAFRRALGRPGVPQWVEFRVRHRSGGWRTMHAAGTGFVDVEGTRSVVVNSRDVTSQRRHERELAARAELSAWMVDVGAGLTGRAELEEALRHCCTVSADRLEGVYCVIGPRPPAGAPRLAASSGPCEEPALRSGLDPQDSVLQFVMRDGIHYTTNAAGQDSRIPEQVWLRRNEFVAFSGTPLQVEGRNVGAFALFARRPLSESVHESARTIAHQISLAIHQRRAEQELVEQRRLLQHVLSNIPQGVFWKDRQGVFLGASQRLAEALGADSPEAVVGRTDFDFSPPDVADWFRSCDQDVMETGVPLLDFEESLVGPDGVRRSLLTSKVPLKGADGSVIGILGIFADITELKEQQASLRRLAAAVDQVREGIVVTDAEGTIEYVNPAVQAMTGYDVDELLGGNPRIFSSGQQSQDLYAELWSTIRSGKTWQGTFVNRRKDGTLYEEESTISPVRDESGAISQYVDVKRDVTERNRMEGQLRQAQRMESIGGLAAGIAHEINTPIQYIGDNVRFLGEVFDDLTGAIGAASALARESADGPRDVDALRSALSDAFEHADAAELAQDVPAAIRQTLEGIEQVATIVRSMKEFAHPARDRRPVDVNHAVENTVAVARNEWKNVAEIRLDLDPAGPCVEWVPAELNQVILNLIVNAAHAVGDAQRARGDAAGKGMIAISTRGGDDGVRIEVADDGTGIPEDVRQRIFDPFFTTKAPGKGTGQGLSILHRLVTETYGGTIDVETTSGRGTTFIIRVPPAAAATDAALESAAGGDRRAR